MLAKSHSSMFYALLTLFSYQDSTFNVLIKFGLICFLMLPVCGNFCNSL
jgi:hypothetical protein